MKPKRPALTPQAIAQLRRSVSMRSGSKFSWGGREKKGGHAPRPITLRSFDGDKRNG